MPINKKLYFIGGAAILAVAVIAGIFFYKNYRDDQIVIAPYNETITRPDIDLDFTYPGGEYGFSLIEPPVTAGGDLLQAFIMMPSQEYAELTSSTDGRESPAAMSIFVFALPPVATTTTPVGTTTDESPSRISRLQNWALEKTTLTSYGSAIATPEVVEVDGLSMLHYRADGLYQQDIYLASYKGRAYMFVGQFNDEKDVTFTAFQQLMKTVSFN